ncbi:MFS transporter [Pseudomonas sp. SED1]|uniref:MFS transporter n=1 Tax=Pseudomonas sp. SED1 TaxID=3056845 RepID=UPI00296F491D|nr:MFS transporter [Pseudomonas sp. SED1]MDY0832061.1 MFS transporter [Pseudomonas sp. SED1]
MAGTRTGPDLSANWGRAHGFALFSLLLGAFLPPLDYFIVNLALPAIRTDLHASDAQLQLVVSAYACAYAVGLITGGRLGDRYGRKRLFLLGVGTFICASMLCGLAHSPDALIAGRVLQGLSASIMAPQVLASIRAVFRAEHQTRITAVYGFVFGVAAIVGQMGGGVLIDLNVLDLGWRAIFLVNVPVGAIVLLTAYFWVPESRASRHARLDLVGVSLLTAVLVMVIYPLAQGAEQGWPAWTIITLMLSVPLLWAFIRVESKVAARGGDPLIDLKVFAEPVIVLGLIAGFLFYTDGVFFLAFGIYLQAGLGWSAMDAGLLLIPFACGFIVGPLLTPILVKHSGYWVVPIGYLLMCGGFGALAIQVGTGTLPGAEQYAALLVAGIGHGIVLPSITRVILVEATREQAGLVSGLIISTLQIGSAFGVALLGGLFFSALGTDSGPVAYGQALQVALFALISLLLVCVGLGVWITVLIRRRTQRHDSQ